MQKVIRWMEEYALAEEGTALLPIGELDKRVAALRDMGRDWQSMNMHQFREAMTVAHFPYYFADALSRAFYADYEYKVGSWRNYTYPDQTPDFRNVDRFRMTEPGTLHRRREKAEAKATSVEESLIEYGVDEFSEQFDVSWQTILNDDLNKIRETPVRMARAAARWLDQFVSALYDNATTQATIAALGAPWAGTGRLTPANLAIGINAMMQRTDVNGNQMNIRRVFLVIPPILQVQASTILRDLLQYGGANSNILADYIAGIYVDPYIATASPNVPWYLFADPNEIPTVTVARLQGWPGPIVAMKQSDIQLIQGQAPAAFLMGSFASGDIEFMVEDVIGGWDNASYVGVTDFRGLYYSSGTTP